MTIVQVLLSINTYPIPDNTAERICIDRGLVGSDAYTQAMGQTQAFELATADIYWYLSKQPSLTEQEVGINQALQMKKDFLDAANEIYARYTDSKLSGTSFGFVGENYNG
jgi:hypothetical protein